MPLTVTHTFVSGKADGGDATLVRPSNWNAAHTITGDAVPYGTIVMYGGTTAPSGWLLCFGQAVSRATYTNLFTAISTNFGVGDGSTTFNLPDLRGRVAVGKDDMGGSAAGRVTGAATQGATGGAETVTHNHGADTGSFTPSGSGTTYVSSTIAASPSVLQPYQVTTYIIYTGV